MSSLDLNKVFLRERKGWCCCSCVPICMICLYVVHMHLKDDQSVKDVCISRYGKWRNIRTAKVHAMYG